MLLSTEVETGLNSKTAKRYELLGYHIPRVNKNGKMVIERGTKITVKVKDLLKGSNVKVLVQCDHCEKIYYLSYFDYIKHLHGDKTYCSNCAAKVLFSGENHYLWDSSKTQEERILKRQTVNGYTDFIKMVLKRDDYTCSCCKKKGVALNVHHLNGYDWFIEGRVDIKNGITLCENCHKNFHSIYGRGHNTKEQYEQWIGKAINNIEIHNGDLPIIKKVYCFEHDVIYNSVDDFCNKNNIKYNTYAYAVCNHKIQGNQKRNVTPKTICGLHIVWYDEFLAMSENERLNYISNNKGVICKKVICVNLNKIFNSISEASRVSSANRTAISKCCNGYQEYCLSKNGEKLTWMFLDEYLQQAS